MQIIGESLGCVFAAILILFVVAFRIALFVTVVLLMLWLVINVFNGQLFALLAGV